MKLKEKLNAFVKNFVWLTREKSMKNNLAEEIA
jgi:hypothetical protein